MEVKAHAFNYYMSLDFFTLRNLDMSPPLSRMRLRRETTYISPPMLVPILRQLLLDPN